jgi:hypothetical protein
MSYFNKISKSHLKKNILAVKVKNTKKEEVQEKSIVKVVCLKMHQQQFLEHQKQ